MQQFTGWGTGTDIVGDGHHYGLGLWTDATLTLPRMVNTSVPGIWPYLGYIGHGGADYGTYITSGFHPTLRTAPLSPYTPKAVTYHEPTVM